MTTSIKDYSELITRLYSVLLNDHSVQDLLPDLRLATDSDSCVLVLRYPAELDTGLMLSDGLSSKEATEPDNPYSSHFYTMDPFVDLPEGQVVALDEFVSAEALEDSEFYKRLLRPNGIYHILAADFRDPDGISASLRLLRGKNRRAFGAEPRRLLALLLPHLRQILTLYQQQHNTESERSLFERAINHMSLACIILDENRRLMRTNSGADRLLESAEGISVRGDKLHLSTRQKSQDLQTAIGKILAAQRSGEFGMARVMAVPRALDTPGLGMVLKPVPRSDWFEGQSTPSVVIFISDPEQALSTSADALRTLFALTAAEAKLSLLLAEGKSLDQVANQLGISTNTGRAHLRAIFAKTGVTQQTQLVSLILRSVANLG
jgi:DNA-binding CsgD family transcriptional regulator